MKKGSLSLSVNAIVIFVLAFAMLGFGIFIINMLQSEVGAVVPDILSRDSWDSPPNSETPIAFKGTFNFKPGDTSTMGIGFYNQQPTTLTVSPNGDLECSPPLSGENGKITLNTLSQDVPARDWAPFEVRVIVGKQVEPDTYICNIKSYEGSTSKATVQKSITIQG